MHLLHSIVLGLTAVAGLAHAVSFTNPLKAYNGSDPFIAYTGGYYYLTTTTWTDVQVTRAKTIEGLKTGEKKVAWKDTNELRCCQVWAPEIHSIDGTWYIYYTAGRLDGDLGGQRTHVVKGGKTPWDTYTYLGQLTTDWGIDSTVAVIASKRYLIWSCISLDLQSLCIAPLTSPSTIGTITSISHPTLSWEKEEDQLPVNEGPVVMQRGGKTFLVFSASFCWTDKYQLGVLTLTTGADPTKEASWTKSGPVFSTANGNYGTGHNGIFMSPDGTEYWNVYHATTVATGNCDGNRYTSVQKINWNTDGTPNFGQAVALGVSQVGPSGE